MSDLMNIHKHFYAKNDKIYQDNFILKYCVTKNIQRRRPKDGSRSSRNMSTKYFLYKKTDGKMLRVCKSAFMSILNVKNDRITGVLRRSHQSSGGLAKETRGGDHRSQKNEEKRIAIHNFIQSFQCSESHYCRGKSDGRVYLSADLNIKKMWRLYNKSTSPESKVKQSFFRKELNINYNIGFGSPRTDVCSRCTELLENIKVAKTHEEKQSLIVTKRVHSLKAKAFYNLLKDEDSKIMSLSFDCQKNHCLPKLPDQSAYFSRQYNFYNFTIVIGNSKSNLTTENVLCYYWYETERPKGSNEIASAVYHTLKTLNIPEHIKILRLFADGCGGQNKNTILIGMCCKWLYSFAPVHLKKIEIIFPVVGHSFLPADRVFAKVEKDIRKREVIMKPEEYVEILSQHGKTFHLSQEVPVLDWKTAVNAVFKPPGSWHFGFNISKRFFLYKGKTNVFVQGEENYRSERNDKKLVTKKGKSVSILSPINLPVGTNMKKEKVIDVCKLLQKHYGENWRELSDLNYYYNAEQAYLNGTSTSNEENENEDIVCERVVENEQFV